MTDEAPKRESDATFESLPHTRDNFDEHTSVEDIGARIAKDRTQRGSDAVAQVWSLGMPAYAVADRFVDSDVVAMVVRNSGARSARMIIVDSAARDDFAIVSAESALRMDELQQLEASGRRIIAIFSDGKMSLRTLDESGTEIVSWCRAVTPIYSGADRLRSIRRLTAEAVPETVPGVGLVRFAPPKGSAAWVAATAWIYDYHAAVCRAAADAVRADPSLLNAARESIKAWANIGPSAMRDGLRMWADILSREPPDDKLTAVLEALLAQGPEAALLHRTSPFSGMLPPAIREMILREIDAR